MDPREEFKEDIITFRAAIIDVVKKRFDIDKQVPPTVFMLIAENGKVGISVAEGLGELFTTTEGKDAAVAIIKQLNDTHKPVAIGFVMEAWMVKESAAGIKKILDKDGNYKEDAVRPSESPNRIECINISFETFDQQSMCLYNIIREGDGVSLETEFENEWAPKSKDHSGRFANLLKDNTQELLKAMENLNIKSNTDNT